MNPIQGPRIPQYTGEGLKQAPQDQQSPIYEFFG
ncbi:hypothetical protein BGLA2_420114 [Burkholderia gladioli]|nr:hypothetical protein BGLA2_420114 [Burkholderia gladioli]